VAFFWWQALSSGALIVEQNPTLSSSESTMLLMDLFATDAFPLQRRSSKKTIKYWS
jgi:hypothetical protein